MSLPVIPRVSPELARSARDFFQPFYKVPQTDDDGLEMATNVLGAFGLFAKWETQRQAQQPAPAPSVPAVAPPRLRRSTVPATPAVAPTRRVRSTSVKSLKE